MYICKNIEVWVYEYIHIHTRTYTYIYIYVNICMYNIYLLIYIYTHTHMYTYQGWWGGTKWRCNAPPSRCCGICPGSMWDRLQSFCTWRMPPCRLLQLILPRMPGVCVCERERERERARQTMPGLCESEGVCVRENDPTRLVCVCGCVCVCERSCHTHRWVMSHTWKSYVTHVNETCHTHRWAMSLV